MTISQRDKRADKAFAIVQVIYISLGRQLPGPKRLRELATDCRNAALLLEDLADA